MYTKKYFLIFMCMVSCHAHLMSKVVPPNMAAPRVKTSTSSSQNEPDMPAFTGKNNQLTTKSTMPTQRQKAQQASEVGSSMQPDDFDSGVNTTQQSELSFTTKPKTPELGLTLAAKSKVSSPAVNLVKQSKVAESGTNLTLQPNDFESGASLDLQSKTSVHTPQALATSQSKSSLSFNFVPSFMKRKTSPAANKSKSEQAELDLNQGDVAFEAPEKRIPSDTKLAQAQKSLSAAQQAAKSLAGTKNEAIAQQAIVKAQNKVTAEQKNQNKAVAIDNIKKNTQLKDGQTIAKATLREDGTGSVIVHSSGSSKKVDTMSIQEFQADGAPLLGSDGKPVVISFSMSDYRAKIKATQLTSQKGASKNSHVALEEIADDITASMLGADTVAVDVMNNLKKSPDYIKFKQSLIQKINKPGLVDQTVGSVQNFIGFLADTDVTKFVKNIGKTVMPKKVLTKIPVGVRLKTVWEKKASDANNSINSSNYTMYSVEDALVDIEYSLREALGKTQKTVPRESVSTRTFVQQAASTVPPQA